MLALCGDANVVVAIPADVGPRAGKASSAVDLGGKPEFVVSDGQGQVFVNQVKKNEIAVVNTKTMKITAKWPVAPAAQPVGLSTDRSGKRLYVGCRSRQMVLLRAGFDATTGVIDLPTADGQGRSPTSGSFKVLVVAKTLQHGLHFDLSAFMEQLARVA